MTTDTPILLLGRCGLERVANPLRELTQCPVTVAGWTQVELVARLDPSIVYVDLFDWDTIAPLTSAAVAGEPIELDSGPLESVIRALQPHRSRVVYRGLRRPTAGAFGLLERNPELERVLERLEQLIESERVLDVAGLWSRQGVQLDDLEFGMGHGEAGPEGAKHEAQWLHALWYARTRGPVKCVVLDLDDTLFHGKISDEDFHENNPAYLPEGQQPKRSLLEGWWRLRRGLHEALKIVARRGIVLAVATRNDPEVVRRCWRKRAMVPDGDPGPYRWMYDDLPAEIREGAFELHPETLNRIALGPEDMVQIEAGFEPKSQMCRRIAAHLGIGMDRLAFLDDSPYEREEVRCNAPEVYVVDTAVDDFRYQLLHHHRFTTWDQSSVAEKRLASYRSRAEVSQASDSPDIEGFLHGLQLKVGVRLAKRGEEYRINELLQRTNQLNLTGKLPHIQAGDLERVYVAWCRDRIADHGVVAVGVFGETHLEAWVCSCRVLPHRIAGTILWSMRQLQPEAIVERIDTTKNGATIGLIEEAAKGPAPWVKLAQC